MDARHPGDMEQQQQQQTSPVVETTSPKDGYMSRTAAQDLPSRSYFSSHGNYDPQTGTRYSASIESIRAHSVALGDLQMADDTTGRLDESRLSISRSPPITMEPTGSSNLSLLLDQQNAKLHNQQPQQPPQHRIRKTSTYDEEASPLLQQVETARTASTRYHSIDSSYSTATTPHHHHHQQQHDHDHVPPIKGKMRHSSSSWLHWIRQPISYIPAVILGLLLNLLDAISYGMITFPLNNPIFASFGPDGISMFFVSCIIAQLVYSCGGSIFAGGNGSMMIEVVPFLHIIAEQIVDYIGDNHKQEIIASTMVAFALSSIMTGLAFFLLGAFKLGSLIGFFPRHILVGTIGGVGWFLIATGIEVSGRLEENLTYTIPMMQKIFLDTHTLVLWATAFGAAVLLRTMQQRISNPLLVPAFFMVLPIVFYLVLAIAGLDVNDVRDQGWIFPLVQSDLPFWHFYTNFDFTMVNWRAVGHTMPAMLALTFFGLLHVPINVPALGVSTNNDDVNVNRELIAHGMSNAISGLFGSIQNYLVYTNSLLFIRTGGDSRVAGIMLAGATAALWMVGPWIVGYIPVMVVGALIFHLGLDLLKEALYDTWHCVHYFEYLTICVIIFVMAVWGFVEGILVGIVMACIFFVVQNAQLSDAIRSTHTGAELRSTVRRLYRQQKFLKYVGSQIQVVKLQGYLFFGTINQVESAIRDMLDQRAWDRKPIRFLVLDLQLVQGIDFSAAEAFVRIRRLLKARDVYMVLCNIARDSDQAKALMKAGVWVDDEDHEDDTNSDLKCFESLNDGLEWCENILLEACTTYLAAKGGPLPIKDSATQNSDDTHIDMVYEASPRRRMVSHAIRKILPADTPTSPAHTHANLSQPTLLMIQALSELTHQDVPFEFYHKLGTYFKRETLVGGEAIWHEGDPSDCLIVVENGTLRSLMHVGNGENRVVETILAGTVVGELGLFTSAQHRTRSVYAEQNSVIWKLTRESFEHMLSSDPALANQFIMLSLHFSSERLDIMTRFAFQLH